MHAYICTYIHVCIYMYMYLRINVVRYGVAQELFSPLYYLLYSLMATPFGPNSLLNICYLETLCWLIHTAQCLLPATLPMCLSSHCPGCPWLGPRLWRLVFWSVSLRLWTEDFCYACLLYTSPSPRD